MQKGNVFGIFFLLIGSAGFSVQGEAATLFVDGSSGNDQGGANDCTDDEQPCETIQHAVDAAQGGDRIEISNAVYTEILKIGKPLVLTGESRGATIIQADSDRSTASDRVISVAQDTNLELSDVTIRHGNTGLNGGGLESIGGDLLIERVLFTLNDAAEAGAGVWAGGGSVVMNDVVFRDNNAEEEAGGAFLGQNFVLTDVTLNDVSFDNNVAGNAAGLFLSNSQAILTNAAFVANVTSGNGGGLWYEGSNSVTSSLQLRDVVFIGNSAVNGGGMYTRFDDTPYRLTNVLFRGNFARLGGGLFNQSGSAGERILTNVTLSGNRAELRGGAVDKPLDMTFRNSIIWNNSDRSGIGTAESSLDDFFSDSIVEVSNSLIQGYPANEFPGSDNLDGTDPDNNPLFRNAVNPSAAPSLVGDLRLELESPVRDVGNNGFVTGVGTDLDGKPRVVNGIVDLGPYEGDDIIFSDGFEDSGQRL